MLSENIDNILINHTEMTNNDLEKTYNESDILVIMIIILAMILLKIKKI